MGSIPIARSTPLESLGHVGIRDLLIAAAALNPVAPLLVGSFKADDHTGPSNKQVLTPFSTNKEGFPVDARGGAGDI